MAFRFLSSISDPAAYKLALRVVGGEGESLTEAEREAVVAAYKKYLSQVTDDTVCRALLLTDTVEKPGELTAAPLAKLLGEKDLAALVLLGELAERGAEEISAEQTARALACEDGVVKIALCRAILDKLTLKSDLSARKDEIVGLCDFLKSCDDAALYDGSVLAMGVRSKWS